MIRRARHRTGIDAAVLAAALWTALGGLSGCDTARVTERPRALAAANPPVQAAPDSSLKAPPSPQPPPAPTSGSPPPATPPAPSVAATLDPSETVNTAANAPLPPCAPAQPKPHHSRKRTTKEAPQGPPPPNTAAGPPYDAVIDAQVGQIGAPLTSILGKNVVGPKGEDLGRVVDLLADANGRVRAGIIDFGGFLGVGTRRIAVDWPLLRFSPNAEDKSIHLSVTREKLQSAPVYTDSARPRVLVPPAIAAPTDGVPPHAAAAGQTKK
jgi:hypothetical protein